MNDYILLVEDNPDDVKLTELAFRKSKLLNEVVVVNDGVAALEHLESAASRRTQPALVLLDLKLPKMDGLEVLKHIRADARFKFLPVVVLTSSKEEQDILSSYDRGANSYIRKPVDFDRFVEAVRQLGLYWLLLNECPPQIRFQA
jgi:two-component system, response regulator